MLGDHENVLSGLTVNLSVNFCVNEPVNRLFQDL